MPVIGRDKNFEIPNLLLAYITVNFSVVFLVRLQTMCFYISRIALKAVSVY